MNTKPLLVNLPIIEENLLLLKDSKIFSCIDLSQGYFHLRVAEDSLKFMYQAGPSYYTRYEYMPQGLRNAGAYFSMRVRNLHQRLPKRLQKYTVFYLDDIMLHFPTIEEHYQVLSEIVPILQNPGVILNTPKCEFFQTNVEYLGF